LLDSGSEVTLIPTSHVGSRKIQWTGRKLWAANGTEIPVCGWISLTAYVRKTRVEIDGLVTDHVKDIFLGADWLQLNDVEWKFGKGEVVIDGARHRLVSRRSREAWCRRVVADSNFIIPARSQYDVTAKAVFNKLPAEEEDRSEAWATEPREIKDGLLVASTVLPNRAANLPVRVLNTTANSITIHKGSTISDLSSVSTQPAQNVAKLEINGRPSGCRRHGIASRLIHNGTS